MCERETQRGTYPRGRSGVPVWLNSELRQNRLCDHRVRSAGGRQLGSGHMQARGSSRAANRRRAARMMGVLCAGCSRLGALTAVLFLISGGLTFVIRDSTYSKKQIIRSVLMNSNIGQLNSRFLDFFYTVRYPANLTVDQQDTRHKTDGHRRIHRGPRHDHHHNRAAAPPLVALSPASAGLLLRHRRPVTPSPRGCSACALSTSRSASAPLPLRLCRCPSTAQAASQPPTTTRG